MRNRYDELRRSSWEIPLGKQKLAVLEEMISIADRYLPEDDAFYARIDYMKCALEAGYRERIIVAFSWCLAAFERNPSDYSRHTVMWYYKWVLNEVWRMPEFSLVQVEAVFEDFKQKCLEYGYSLRPYYQQKVNFMMSQGMLQEAADHYKLWRSSKRDDLCDCRACEQNLMGQYLISVKQMKRGMQTLKPILTGEMTCHAVPQNTYSMIIQPLIKLKEYEEAMKTATKAARALKGAEYIEEYGLLIEFFSITNMDKAVKLYKDTIHYALESKVGWQKFNYFLSIRIFLKEWHKKKRRKQLLLSEIVTLDWLDEQIEALCSKFNERNGNDYMSQFTIEKDNNAKQLLNIYQKNQLI